MHFDKEGKEIYYSISTYPIYEKEKLVAVAEISKDITKDIKLQKTMMQQQKLASIGRLAAGVAHEINNPMTTILTTAMLLQEDLDQDDPTYLELKTISDETLRCRKIVTSLLDFARQSKPIKKACQINKIVADCITLTRKQAAFEDITIISNLSEDLPLVSVDKDQIQQALINLSLNAIEAIKKGGKIIFTTRLSSPRDAIEILVSDTGEGIPEENLNTIFEPFFTTKETGTGLGLAITFGLIEQHGGTIEVENRLGKGRSFAILGEGSTFTIRLPIDREGRNAD
ncbi:MAG: hypothetical protein ISR62_09005 [Desulfobacteraceae bacterium]|nr:hypothetical protein [Desulfobacteraceae bacterium]